MAQINIITSSEEQEAVLSALRHMVGKTKSVPEIAAVSMLKACRVRYVLTDLEDAGKIRRVPTKAFNAHYIRYTYEVLK